MENTIVHVPQVSVEVSSSVVHETNIQTNEMKSKKATENVETVPLHHALTLGPHRPRPLHAIPRPVTNGQQRNILITSALPYVNNVPHLGTLIGCVLSADVYARFCRLRGHNTLFVCGTDEYGTATETKAMEMGLSPKQVCDYFYQIHTDIYEYFCVQFDHFGRTSTPEQTEVTQDIFQRLDERGYISEGEIVQLYCETCHRFLADRFVEGTCYHEGCSYTDARGDQCDKCGRLIDAAQLINPRCKSCNKTPMLRSSKHLFLLMDKLQPVLRTWVDKHKKNWSENAVAITEEWLAKGLQPRCITRDLKWGTPVPKPGFEDKVFYVWFDACIGYVSITATLMKEWREWWFQREEANIELVQFMGKDNVPFHCAMFPCEQLGTGQQWTMLHRISTTEFLNYEGGKFSKSRNIGVFGDNVRDSGIAIEVWRFYLLANRPETADAMFLWADFAAKSNADLLNNIGNLCYRSLSFITARFCGIVPSVDVTDVEIELMSDINELLAEYILQLENIQIRDSVATALRIASRCNKYLQDNKPWEIFASDPQRASTIIGMAANAIGLVALIFEPHMPSFSEKVYSQLNYRFPHDALADSAQGHPFTFQPYLPPEHKIGQPFPIFKRIDESLVEDLRDRYSNREKEAPRFPLDLRVGYIINVDNHPKVDNLYVLTVDLGDRKRTIVAGLKRFLTGQQLINRAVAVLVNVQSSNFKGVQSDGMILMGAKGTSHASTVDVDDRAVNAAGVPVSIATGSRIIPKGALLDVPDIFDVKSDFKKLALTLSADGLVHFHKMPLVVDGLSVDIPFRVHGAVESGIKGWRIQ